MAILEKTIVVGAFQCNCRLFACPKTGHAILVDPGDEPTKILTALENLRVPSGAAVQVKYLLHTHGHLDHIGATRTVKEKLVSPQTHSATIALHKGDLELYQNLQVQGQFFGFQYENPLPVEHFLEDQEELQVGELKLSIVHTPGHSPGSVCIRLNEDSSLGIRETLLTGDTLFKNGVGRTDLWGGNEELMFRNIRHRILSLDGDTRVCPGHGPDSTIGQEKINLRQMGL